MNAAMPWRPIAPIFLICLVSGACVRSTVPPPVPTTLPTDNSYLDLHPGMHLRIVVPIVSTGGYQVSPAASETVGNTVTMTASQLVGYDTAHYLVKGRDKDKAKLHFIANDVTRNGKTGRTMTSPSLPFPLPTKLLCLRLIYLTRSSPSDHNMAITAGPSRKALSAFGDRLLSDPSVCPSQTPVFCSWVPAGIAVRTE